jgi:CubicO group peptidase (beta-lactamase class C family)
MAAGSAAGVSQGPTPTSVDSAFQKIWTTYHDKAVLLGLCVGAVDEGVSRIGCFGKKGPNLDIPPDEHTLFQIASVTKTFGATLLALRVVQGKAFLSDKARDYVPDLVAKVLFPPQLTLLDLAQHYSGLPHSTPPHVKDVTDFLRRTGTCFRNPNCVVAPPETRWAYSNWGISTLGTLLALHDGFPDGPLGPWVADNRQSITGPLGMTETRLWQDWMQNDLALFNAHRAVSGTETFDQSPFEGPGSGIYSSPHDMLIWLQYSMGVAGSGDLASARHLLYDDSSFWRDSRPPNQIGLVWNIEPTVDRKASCVSKAGDAGDFHSYVLFVPGQRGVFLLVNRTPTKPSYRTIATKLLNLLPGTGPACPMPGSTDSG